MGNAGQLVIGPPYDVVFFDCDSTLSAIEGIDELARAAGCYDEVAALTRSAMKGDIPLQSVYGARLDRIGPTKDALEDLGALYVERLVSGARETIDRLVESGHDVHVVSGGLLPAVAQVAAYLGVPAHRVHAVPLSFDADGAYAGFDASSPLAQTGGKPRVCGAALSEGQRAVMVGDGATDLEVTDVGIDFIGFGGVVVRPDVRAQASCFVDDDDLRAVLPHILDARRLDRTGS